MGPESSSLLHGPGVGPESILLYGPGVGPESILLHGPGVGPESSSLLDGPGMGPESSILLHGPGVGPESLLHGPGVGPESSILLDGAGVGPEFSVIPSSFSLSSTRRHFEQCCELKCLNGFSCMSKLLITLRSPSVTTSLKYFLNSSSSVMPSRCGQAVETLEPSLDNDPTSSSLSGQCSHGYK